MGGTRGGRKGSKSTQWELQPTPNVNALDIAAAEDSSAAPEDEAREGNPVSESGLVLPGRALGAGSEPLGGGLSQSAERD
jgi:hypothetical protein